ncbi:PREDICTED: histone deacetylase HDT1-like [Lupinus angustifolius]|uniref:histone deacetylase HDT1-like n=1 Tax=Lupinus angustifolius TaxID=3871 RepID=UPI00092FC226|nr:PREDICTED: histone deacetylase HDT1-like [Lupinus angustifolius]
MEFWGTEVKVGEVVKVDPEEIEAYVHLSQAALGESKKDKANEPVVLHLKVGEQKIVLGTLSRDKIPQTTLEVVLDKEFELSHSSKSSSVFFCGYKALIPDEEDSDEDDFDSDEDIPLPVKENGKSVIKAEDAKVSEPKKANAKGGAPAKQVKIADPKKEDDEEDDDSDDDDDFGSSDDEVDDVDSDSDDEGDSEDDEETPTKKVVPGKKRANDSASKTPVSNKKAKNATPEKTDGKKGGHTDTPHPAKKAGKTPKSDGKAQTPKSAGQFSCGSCQKAFNSEGGLQQHNKAKHDK